MQIVPMRDLKDTVEIEKKCENVDIDYYEKQLAQSAEAGFINRGLKDYQEDKVKDGKTALQEVRSKYGI